MQYEEIMREKDALRRITIDPQICHGNPVVRSMRWPVEVIIDLLSSGMTNEEIIVDHPELEIKDIHAAINYNLQRQN